MIATFATLPRKLSALRFASALSVLISIFVVLVIVSEAAVGNGTSESIGSGFDRGADKKQLTVTGFFTSFPLIIFSYMYQVNIPAIYQELEQKNLGTAKTVIFSGTALAAIAYITAGIFGYVAFADGSSTEEIDKYFSDNILSAPYTTDKGKTPVPIYVSLFGMMIVVVFATPFCVLPTKDSIEEV